MKASKVERESWPWWNHSHWAEGSYRELEGHSYSQRCPPPSQSHRFRCPRTCKIFFMVLSMDFLVKKLVFKTFRIFHIWIRFICLLIGKSFCGPAGSLSNTVVFFSSSTFFSFIIFFSPLILLYLHPICKYYYWSDSMLSLYTFSCYKSHKHCL